MASAEREPITGVWRRSDETTTTSPYKNSSDLYQFQERPLAKVGWSPPRGDATDWRYFMFLIIGKLPRGSDANDVSVPLQCDLV